MEILVFSKLILLPMEHLAIKMEGLATLVLSVFGSILGFLQIPSVRTALRTRSCSTARAYPIQNNGYVLPAKWKKVDVHKQGLITDEGAGISANFCYSSLRNWS